MSNKVFHHISKHREELAKVAIKMRRAAECFDDLEVSGNVFDTCSQCKLKLRSNIKVKIRFPNHRHG